MSTMRLGTRLALATGAAVCLAVLLISAVGFVLIRDQGLKATDLALREDAEANIASLQAGDLDDRDFLEAPADGASTLVAPNEGDLDPGTEVEVEGGPDPGPPIPESSLDPVENPGAVTDESAPVGTPFTVEENGRTLRRLILEEPDADGAIQTYTFSRSVGDTEAIIRVARYLLLAVAILASLLAIGFVLLLVGRAVRPLTAAQSAADHVADSGDLSVRIPEGRPDEVGRLARAMNIMLGRLEKARGRLRETVEEQRNFAADASHELRTPLTALRGDIELLLAHDLPDEERREVLQDMSRSSQRMGSLVEGLLSLARLEAIPTETRQHVDLAALVEPMLLDDRELADPGSEPILALGSPEAIESIFSNLIDNARKYGGAVRVSIELEGREVVARVDDDGPGIPAEDRARIFDRFHRAQAVRERPGAGLGLAIARGAAEAMDGSLELLDSTIGTRFEVRLPAASAEAAQRPATADTAQN